MRRDIGTLALTASIVCAGSALADPTITEFDVPGAHSTHVSAIGNGGDVTGVYGRKNGAGFGFVRKSDGSFLSFGQADARPVAINASGETAGYRQDAINDAFVASADGTVTSFLPPGAGRFGGSATGIDSKGNVAGNFYDANTVAHGFLRSKSGHIVTFDAPGAGTQVQSGTFVTGLASGGIVAGYVLDDSNVYHGFLRAKDGTFTTIDVPGAGGDPFEGTHVFCVSANGTVGGNYGDAQKVYHGFLRDIAGNVTTFDVTRSISTTVYGVNSKGVAVGNFGTEDGPTHGFERLPSGNIVTINAPDAGHASDDGTFPDGINDHGEVAGGYNKKSGNSRGFLWTNN
jgi:hypothetical protein